MAVECATGLAMDSTMRWAMKARLACRRAEEMRLRIDGGVGPWMSGFTAIRKASDHMPLQPGRQTESSEALGRLSSVGICRSHRATMQPNEIVIEDRRTGAPGHRRRRRRRREVSHVRCDRPVARQPSRAPERRGTAHRRTRRCSPEPIYGVASEVIDPYDVRLRIALSRAEQFDEPSEISAHEIVPIDVSELLLIEVALERMAPPRDGAEPIAPADDTAGLHQRTSCPKPGAT
jgi:hypothetical protein